MFIICYCICTKYISFNIIILEFYELFVFLADQAYTGNASRTVFIILPGITRYTGLPAYDLPYSTGLASWASRAS